MNYIILNGVNSNTITGLLIQELPPISKPLMRTQIDQIDGRDGDIVTKLGYSTVDKELSIGLHGNYDIDTVIEYFASEGTVIFSNEPDKYYRYQVLDQIDFERLVRFRTATVTMHCQPFKYEVNEDPIEEAGSTDTTGDIVSFETQSTDAVGVKVNVEPYQNLNGYDHPWVGGAGKNKLNPTGVVGTQGGLTFAVTSEQKITISGTFSSAVYRQVVADAKLLPSTSYIVSGALPSIQIRIREYDSNNTLLATTLSSGTTTFTTNANTVKSDVYLVVNALSSTTTISAMIRLATESDATFAPYENICPIYPANGKNLLEITEPSGTGAGVTYTNNPNGSVTISGTASGTSLHRFGSIPLKSGETYILSGNDSIVQMSLRDSTGGTVYVNNLETYTPTSDVNAWYFYRVASGQSVNVTLYPMVRHAEITDASYVPYNAIGITRTGANIWDEEWELGGLNSTTGLPYSSNTLIRSKNYQKCLPSTQYYSYRGGTTGDVGLFWFDENLKFIRSNSAVNRTITSPENACYFKVAPNSAYGTEYRNDISINYPSSVQTYEPYQGERYYPISDNPVYGGTLEVETGVLTLTHGVKIYDGTENWSIEYTYNFYSGTGRGSGSQQTDYQCSHWKYNNITGNSTDTSKMPSAYISASGNFNVQRADIPHTGADMKQWCLNQYQNGTPLTVVFRLNTPQTYQLTPVQVKTLLGYNNIWTDSGTVTVSVPNMISVVNEGNTTAKPTMTIYGSGDIGVWLNGMQVFQIALGDTGNITIDAEQMEAYQGGILRNRLVTGDYSNFVLQKGENTISVTGNVTSVEITNYSRWL